MVQIISIVGAAALLTSTAMAAPAMRRSQYEQSYDQGKYEVYSSASYDDSSKYDSKQQYDNKPSYDYQQSDDSMYEDSDKVETSMYEEYDNKYTSTSDASYAKETYSKANQYDNQYQYGDMEEDKYETSTAEYAYQTGSDYKYNTYTPEYESSKETSTAEYSYPTYGSGSSDWGSGYDDCVSKCVAKFGAPKSEYTPEARATETASGTIHTVMVAPEAGVLRYWPFALNATVGDTVRYVWTTPANHTATLSSELALCNKSALADERKFVSGVRNGAGSESIFDVVVETEEPQFFYCSVAQHCQKGMFGIINPKSEFGGLDTVGAKMNDWVSSNPDLSAAWSNVHSTTKDTSADSWGNSISTQGIPESAYPDVAANVIWTRAMFGANPGSLETNKGAATPDGSPIKIVGDLSTLLSATNQDPNAASVPQGTPTGTPPVASEVAAELKSGASRNVAGLSAAAIVGLVSFMLL